MATPLIVAAAGSGRFPSPVTIVLVVAAIGYVLWTRMQGQPLAPKRLVVLPALLIILGISDLSGTHQTSADVGFLVGGALLSAALGAARGSTIELFGRGGVLWQRYRPVTAALWVALIVSKVILAIIASVAGAKGGAGTNGLLFTLGLSLLAESAIVGPRALATHIPFATPSEAR